MSLVFLVVLIPVSVLLVKQATRLFSDASSNSSILPAHEDSTRIISQANQSQIIKTVFDNPGGWNKLKEMAIWADVHSPRGYRLDSSIHAKLINNGNGGFLLVGERYNNGTIICGSNQNPRHCGRNYSWDVGNLPVPSSTNLLFMNHDDQVTDTIQRTNNTIASVAVLAINPINDQQVEVQWQITPTAFFADRFLDIYTSAIDERNKPLYAESPNWRQYKQWSIREPGNAINANLFSGNKFVSFEPNLPGQWEYMTDRTKPTVRLTSSFNYDGKKSLLLSQMGLVIFDLGSQQQGVLTARFYDDLNPSTSFYLSLSNKDDVHWLDPDAHTIVVGVRPQVSSSNYVYKARLEDSQGKSIPGGGEERYFDTQVARTKGWHTVRFWITPGGGWAEIDDSANQITYRNLSTLPLTVNSNGKAISFDYQATQARYLRIGKWVNDGSVAIDKISFNNLPPLPIASSDELSSFSGTVDWENYYAAFYLDTYEDATRFGNMERVHQRLQDVPGSFGNNWWYESLSDVALASSIRYRQTGLPYYQTHLNRIINFVISKINAGDIPDDNPGFPSSFFSNIYAEYVTMLWPQLSDNNRQLLRQAFINQLDSSLTENWSVSKHIGDSAAEDYSVGVATANLVGSIAFANEPNAQAWGEMGLTYARRALSTNSSESCSFCPNGIVGVKTIYAPNEQIRDCQPGENTENCLCPGDRATITRPDSDFAYLVDNHDFSPHPTYMMSVVASVQNVSYIAQIYRDAGQTLPSWIPNKLTDINPYTEESWRVGLKSYDITRNRYAGNNIHRVRAKAECDGQSPDKPTPYLPEENPFRTAGLDDWGHLPTFSYNPSSFLRVKDMFGYKKITDGTGREFNLNQLVEDTTTNFFYRQFNTINTPVPPSVYIPNDKANIWGDSNPFFVWNRQNGIHGLMTRRGLVDPSIEFPLE